MSLHPGDEQELFDDVKAAYEKARMAANYDTKKIGVMRDLCTDIIRILKPWNTQKEKK